MGRAGRALNGGDADSFCGGASKRAIFLYNSAPMPIVPEHVRPADLKSGPSRGVRREALSITGSVGLGLLGRIEAPYRKRGTVAATLSFQVTDAPGVFRLCGIIACTIDATCQRCLESVTLSIESPVDVGVIERAGDAPPETVVDDFICLDGAPLDVLTVVEDELLLALPFAPRHAPGSCQAAGSGAQPPEEAAEENPFAVLVALKDDEPE